MFFYDEWIKAVNFKFIRFDRNTQKMLNFFSFDYIFLKPFIFTFVSNVWLTWLFVLHCLVLSTYYTGVYILMIMYSQGASSLYNANVRVHNRIFRCDSQAKQSLSSFANTVYDQLLESRGRPSNIIIADQNLSTEGRLRDLRFGFPT